MTRFDRRMSEGPTSTFPERQRGIAAIIGLFFVFEGLAGAILAAAFGFDVVAVGRFGSLMDRGTDAAELLRWGALLDLGGYLAFGLVILYVGQWLWEQDRLVVAALAASGLAAGVVGAVGAALLATVGPWLIVDVGDAARPILDALGRVVVGGLWGVVVLLLFGVWTAGVGWLLLRTERRFGALALIGGAGMLVTSLRTAATGRVISEVAGTLDLLIALAVVAALVAWFAWLVWLAIRLWASSRPRPA
jgi:hypothetical protein